MADLDAVIALTVADRAYMAGFFDGEGSISPLFHKSKKNNGRGVVHFSVNVSQKRTAVLHEFHKVFGGSLFVRDRNTFGKEQTLGVWSIASKEDVTVFLKVMLPYLRVKREEAELALSILTNPSVSFEEFDNVRTMIRDIRTGDRAHG